jgi:hypothetical protein
MTAKANPPEIVRKSAEACAELIPGGRNFDNFCKLYIAIKTFHPIPFVNFVRYTRKQPLQRVSNCVPSYTG